MIKHAAIKKDNIVYVGHRHHNVRDIMVNCGLEKPVTNNAEQGFVNDKGEFLTREEALIEAIECGQIEPAEHRKRLFSEDLY